MSAKSTTSAPDPETKSLKVALVPTEGTEKSKTDSSSAPKSEAKGGEDEESGGEGDGEGDEAAAFVDPDATFISLDPLGLSTFTQSLTMAEGGPPSDDDIDDVDDEGT